MEMNITSELNILTIVFFAGVYFSTIKNHSKQIDELKKDFKENIEHIKKDFEENIVHIRKDFEEKFEDLKMSVGEHFLRVEKKQDIHNQVIERTYNLERNFSIQNEQIKVANHRIKDIESMIRGE